MNTDVKDHGAGRSQAMDVYKSDDEIDLLELVRTLWRGKFWIVIAAVIAGGLGWAYLEYVAVSKYTARAVVALENRQATVVDLDSVMSGLSGDQATINTEVEVLRSRNLMGQLVDEMDLIEDPEFNPFLTADMTPPSDQRQKDATIDEVLKVVSIGNVRSSYVYNITTITTGAQKSRTMVNTLAELYIRDQLTAKYEATAQATAWLTDRVVTLKSELEIAEAAVQSLNASTALVSIEALEGLNRQIKETRDRLNTLVGVQALQSEKLRALKAAQASGERAVILELADDAALTRIAGDGLDDALFKDRLEAVLSQLNLANARSEAQLALLRQSVSTQEADYASQSSDLNTLEQLNREAQATRTIYEYFLSRLKETSVQEGIQQPDSRILSYSAEPTRPSEPRKSRILLLALVLGLMVGVAFVLLREALHTGFRTGEQLERATGLAVLGQIPRIPVRKRRKLVDYLIGKPTSAAAEAVRNLRTSILLSNVDTPPKVILSTSSLSGEGKTSNAFALAQNFSGLGKKILLIEGDIRRRVFAEYFESQETRGLLSVLSGEAEFEDVVQHIDTIGVDIMQGEKSSTNAADVFSSDKFAAFMKEARARYDYIIIDTPPVLLVPDARIIAHEADAVIFAVLWDKTSRTQVREAIRQFEIAGQSITGLVLSQINPKGMKRYGYGGRYGAYGNYGNKYYNN